MRQAHNARRSRGRSNRKHNVPLKHQNFESNGPDVRIRGNAHQVYEKYLAMARDANSSGDRISAEGYYQHAEHYFRIMNDSTDPQNAARQQQQQQQQQRGRENGHDRQARDGESQPAPAAEAPRADEQAAETRDNAEVVELPREAEPAKVNGSGEESAEAPKRRSRRSAKPKAEEAEPAAEEPETPPAGA